MNVVSKKYDEIYRKDSNAFGAGVPIKIIESIPNIISNGLVLDIGAGQGRNTFFFA